MKRNGPGTRTSGAAFTLVELLVVMGIMVLLMGLLLPAITHAMLVVQSAVTQNTINQVKTALAAFHEAFGVYPPSDSEHETGPGVRDTGYETLAICLMGEGGKGWGGGEGLPFGGSSAETYGPFYEAEGGAGGMIGDAFRPSGPILYFRYEASRDPEDTNDAPYDFHDNEADGNKPGFHDQGALNMLVRRRGTYQYVGQDYVLISAGPDRRFGYVREDEDGNLELVTPSNKARPEEDAYDEAFCDDLANFKYGY